MLFKIIFIITIIFSGYTYGFSCTTKNVKGRYSMSLSGTGIEQNPPGIIPFIGPVAGIGLAKLSADGSLELTEHLNGSGQIIENITLKGTFQLDTNCLGEASAINTFNKKEHKYKFIVTDSGRKIYLMMTYPTSPVLLADLIKIDSEKEIK